VFEWLSAVAERREASAQKPRVQPPLGGGKRFKPLDAPQSCFQMVVVSLDEVRGARTRDTRLPHRFIPEEIIPSRPYRFQNLPLAVFGRLAQRHRLKALPPVSLALHREEFLYLAKEREMRIVLLGHMKRGFDVPQDMHVAELDLDARKDALQRGFERWCLVRDHEPERIPDVLQCPGQSLERGVIFSKIQDARDRIVRYEIDRIDERDRLGQPFDPHINAVDTNNPAEAGAICFRDEFVSGK